MEILKSFLSILFLMFSVHYVNETISKIYDDKKIILRIVVLFVTTLLCTFIIDVIIFFEAPQLLRFETRDKILEMVLYLLAGIGAIHFTNNTKN